MQADAGNCRRVPRHRVRGRADSDFRDRGNGIAHRLREQSICARLALAPIRQISAEPNAAEANDQRDDGCGDVHNAAV
jgi:hypothetical protein